MKSNKMVEIQQLCRNKRKESIDRPVDTLDHRLDDAYEMLDEDDSGNDNLYKKYTNQV